MPGSVNWVKSPWLRSPGFRGEATTLVLLNGHVVKLSSKYPWISGVISLHQRSFLLQQTDLNAKTHNWPQCQE